MGRVGSNRMLTLPMVGSTSSTGPCAPIDAHTPRAITAAIETRTACKRKEIKANSWHHVCASTTHSHHRSRVYRVCSTKPQRRPATTCDREAGGCHGYYDDGRYYHVPTQSGSENMQNYWERASAGSLASLLTSSNVIPKAQNWLFVTRRGTRIRNEFKLIRDDEWAIQPNR